MGDADVAAVASSLGTASSTLIVRGGGKVAGALGNGYSCETIDFGCQSAIYYAAEIDAGDGSSPRFVAGMTMDGTATGGDADETFQVLSNALGWFAARVPMSLDDARRRGLLVPDGASGRRIDVRA